MSQQIIPQKFQLSNNEPISEFLSGSAKPAFEDSESISNSYISESSKLQEIKYFDLADTIKGFSNLQPDWDSYNADAISKIAIETAVETLDYLFNKGLFSSGVNMSVFPMRDGGIQFEFDGENICAELEINPNGEWIFILFDDNGNIVESSRLFELFELSILLEEKAQYV